MQLVESFSSACGFGMSLHPATPMPRTTQKAAAMLAMKYAIGKNCFPVLRTRVLGWWAAGDHLLRSLSQVRAEGTRSRLAMKDSIGQKVLSGESPSSMHFSGGLLCHALSPFVPTEFSVLADLIDGAVCAKHTFEASWFCRRPAQRGHISKVRVRGFCDTFRPRSGGENCVSIGRRTRGRAA